MRLGRGRFLPRVGVVVGAALVILAPRPSHGSPMRQASSGGVRLAAFRAEPSSPEFGRTFALEVRLRVAPGVTLLLPDTLLPADASASAGRGTWVDSPGPADSLDVVATFPAVALLNGEVELPILEVWTARSPGGAAAVKSTRGEFANAPPPTEGLERLAISIGRVQVAPLRALSEAGDAMSPRPPADVVGRGWSLWLALAVVLAAAAGAGVAWGGAARIRKHRRAGPSGLPRLSSRREALHELDRIRSLGWHREGKLAQFYAASTDVLRRFSEQREPDWGTALTSTELLDEIRERWGSGRAGAIESVIPAAERTKFGRYRPGPDDAEAHWAAIRDWIEKMPDD